MTPRLFSVIDRWLALYIILGAWIGLAALRYNGHVDLINHGDWTTLGIFKTLCTANPLSSEIVPGLQFIAGWNLMVIAMMLPVALPLFKGAQSLSKRVLLFLGFLIPWNVFGIAVHGFGEVLQELASQSLWWSLNGWITAAALCLGAELYQFTKPKASFLQDCCEPAHNIKPAWPRAAQSNIFMGLSYGINCVMSCSLLMMLMFIYWPGSLIWMFCLTLIMYIDRDNTAASISTTKLIGYGLIISSLTIAGVNVL